MASSPGAPSHYTSEEFWETGCMEKRQQKRLKLLWELLSPEAPPSGVLISGR